MAKKTKEFKRIIEKNGRKIELRVVPPSKQAVAQLGGFPKGELVSPIAINKPSFEKSDRGMERVALLRKLGEMPAPLRQMYLRDNAPIDFVKDKRGMKQFKIICSSCGDDIATVWASDSTLKDWCDLHYLSSYDENTWYGCQVVNISPIDEQLGFECACGQDTRDFRGKNSLPPVLRGVAAQYSMKHRGFNHSEASFISIQI